MPKTYKISQSELDTLTEFFDRTMGKINIADSPLDAQALRNWNEASLIVTKLGK